MSQALQKRAPGLWRGAAYLLLPAGFFLLCASVSATFWAKAAGGGFALLLARLWRLLGFTALSALLGACAAFLLALGFCIFILYVAPKRLRGGLGRLCWVLGAVPAVVMGFLGCRYIFPAVPNAFWGLSLTLCFMLIPRLTAEILPLLLPARTGELLAASRALGAYPYQSVLRCLLPNSVRDLALPALRALSRSLSEGVAVLIALSFFADGPHTLATALMRALGGESSLAEVLAYLFALLAPLSVIFALAFFAKEGQTP
ncbi:MAG: hypothetical protein LBD02_04255 [Christensenellaceae bacterium]|jgi:ABC-type phosphate transport system permease subunit|nr:hypothetical protein [Christensenellaceae bacterium]